MCCSCEGERGVSKLGLCMGWGCEGHRESVCQFCQPVCAV